jgi:hypothetical protein
METNTASTDTATIINCRECGTLEHVKFKRFVPSVSTTPELFYFVCDRCDVDNEFDAALSPDEAVEIWNKRQQTVLN